MWHRLMDLIFPPKCVLCKNLLGAEETDFCHNCRADAPVFIKSKKSIPFVARWTAVWYYKDNVRQSLIRFKFRNHRSYALSYGKLLAMTISENFENFDILTWIPTGFLRKLRRGYDQVFLLASATAQELNLQPVCTLKKIRQTPPQSKISDSAKRRANVLGAYRVLDPEQVSGKRILLLDDIVTTGSTASECARMLMTAGAKEVVCVAVAATEDKKK